MWDHLRQHGAVRFHLTDDRDANGDSGGVGEGPRSSTQLSCATNGTTTTTTTTFLPPLVLHPPLLMALTQHRDYANVVYVKHLVQPGMEIHHQCAGWGIQHKAAIELVA